MDAAMEAKTRILVVEDNPLNREPVVDLLGAEGGSTDTARFRRTFRLLGHDLYEDVVVRSLFCCPRPPAVAHPHG